MNSNQFKLVFSRRLGMYVPVSESAKAQSGGRGESRRRRRAILVLLAMTLGTGSPAWALDVGAVPVNGTVIAPAGVAASSIANIQTSSLPGGNRVTIDQIAQKAVIRWDSFNIGSGSQVIFNQPGASAAALNRVIGNESSLIEGMLKANGQVYLINTNGILFGNGAQVNVGTLLASALDFSEDKFQQSVLSLYDVSKNIDVPTLEGGKGQNVIVGDGAVISTRDTPGGKVVLVAPGKVENAGQIETADGQVVLAAGTKAWFIPSEDSAMRGWVVEMTNGATVTNTSTGSIRADRGNVTLVGMLVNQAGRITATTSVAANGSIYLLARDNPNVVKDADRVISALNPLRGGTVTTAAGSETRVVFDATDTGSVDDNVVFNPSTVLMSGRTISHGGLVEAKGGKVEIGKSNISELLNFTPRDLDTVSGVTLEDGSRIDVSGIQDVALAMERNQIEVELRGDELKDSPQQRNGILKGKAITVEVGKGTPLADVSKQLAAIPRGIQEKLSSGGTVVIDSARDITMKPTAVIDVSGGSLKYAAGTLATTQLVSQGRIYDIGQAPADLIYDAILDGTPRYVESYSEGKDAGTITLSSQGLVADGVFLGRTTIGTYQRDKRSSGSSGPKGSELPLGGQVKFLSNFGADLIGEHVHDVELTPTPGITTLVNGGAPTDLPTRLSLQKLAGGGMTRIEIQRDGNVDLVGQQSVELAPGSNLKLTATFAMNVDAIIRAPGGSLSLSALDLTLSGDSLLSVAGQWINDLAIAGGAATGYALRDGGSITLSGNNLLAGDLSPTEMDPVVLDVSGGGQFLSNGSFKTGKGGNLSINAPVSIQPGFDIRGLATGKGGSLSLTAPEMLIRNAPPSLAELAQGPRWVLPAAWFSQLGFTDYNVRSTDGALTVAANTQLLLQAPYLALTHQARYQPSGAELSGFTSVENDRSLRAPVNLSLNHFASQLKTDLVLATGAQVSADPGASIRLASNQSILIDATIDAPSGTITVTSGSGTGAANQSLNDYSDSLALWLGSNARLSSRGSVINTNNSKGLETGQVLSGGSIDLTTERGWFIAEEGAIVDVSGTSADLDLVSTDRIVRQRVSGDAGSIDIQARDGYVIDATLLGLPGGSGARGGTLELGLDAGGRDFSNIVGLPVPTGLVVELRHDVGRLLGQNLKLGDSLATLRERGLFDTADLAKGQFDSFTAQVGGRSKAVDGVVADVPGTLVFSGKQNLALGRSLTLDANIIQVSDQVGLAAPYINIGSSDLSFVDAPAATGGVGNLTLNAQWIDVVGRLAVSGSATTLFDSQGDIRFIATGGRTTPYGGAMNISGPVEFHADQLYPATATTYTVTASDTLSVTGGGQPGTVLSAGGDLTLRAPSILQAGVVKAPIGHLNLVATDPNGSLILAAGSVTSVSADGALIPYGSVQNKSDWVFALPETATTQLLTAPPSKKLVLKGNSIEVVSTATVDVAGNGDLYAFEHVPGTGGSKDILSAANAGNSFAIIPSLDSTYAPYDPIYQPGHAYQPGETIYLSGGNGLPAGTYTILPARYALLPGAFLITPRAGYQDMQGNSLALSSGAEIVYGKRSVQGTDILDSRSTGYLVESSGLIRSRAQYDDHFANAFFTRKAALENTLRSYLPVDAGRLVLDAGLFLDLKGQLLSGHGAAARGAEIDINALRIALTAGTETAPTGYVAVAVEDLMALGAESILVGGTREEQTDGVLITAGANNLIVMGNADDVVQAPELMLVAKQTIDINKNSVVSAAGDVQRQAVNIALAGDGAFLRVASFGQAEISRDKATGQDGILNLAAGAVVKASGSAALDASRKLDLAGDLDVTGDLHLGAKGISFGTATGDTNGLILDSVRLAQLAKVKGLTLKSAGSVDFYSDVSLGSPAANAITLLGAGIVNHVTGATAHISAKKISLGNSQNQVLAPELADAASGTLVLEAHDLDLQEGNFKLRGFSKVDLTASGDLLGLGNGGLDVALQEHSGQGAGLADLTINANRLLTASGATREIIASGTVALNRPLNTLVSAAQAPIGGNLSIVGKRIDVSTRIDAPSGRISLHARGIDKLDGVYLHNSDILNQDGQLSVAGTSKLFYDTAAYSSGGVISLRSDNGNVESESGAVIDVSATGADAGRLSISASNGKALLDGVTLNGSVKPLVGSSDIHHSGEFILDVGVLADFSNLNRALNDGGFSGLRDIRVRSGDITLAEAETGNNAVRAERVVLTADTGNISVYGGEIDASGTEGGMIGLYAGKNLNLGAGQVNGVYASLSAKGTSGKGGQVELATRSGVLGMAKESQIDVSGTDGGTILLRVPRIDSDSNGVMDSVAVNAFDATLTGADEIILESVQTYTKVGSQNISAIAAGTSVGSTLGIDSVLQDNDVFMAFSSNIRNDLKRTGDAAFHIVAGVEVAAAGDLAVNSDWDLRGWKYDVNGVRSINGSDSGVLTLLAAGNLGLNKNLSDGFSSSLRTGTLLNSAARQWSYRLVGGADTASANPLSVIEGAGSVVLAADTIVRTGTGDIQVAAGKDFTLGGTNQTSAVLYTAGYESPAVNEFATPTGKGVIANYAIDGGDISISARGNVQGAVTHQLFTEWLQRQGATSSSTGTILYNTSWWVNLPNFRQNVGALGGGNIRVKAGGDVNNFSAVIPTTGRLPGAFGATPVAADLVVTGGGNLDIEAGRDILSGTYLVMGGSGHLKAGRDVTSGRNVGATNPTSSLAAKPFYSIIGLADADFDIRANGSVFLETVANPTVVAQDSSVFGTNTNAAPRTYFFTYEDSDAVKIQSLSGDVAMNNDVEAIKDATVKVGTRNGIQYRSDGSDKAAYNALPPSLFAQAWGGDVTINFPVDLYPSAQGNVNLLADGNVLIQKNAYIYLSDQDAKLLQNVVRIPATSKTIYNVSFARLNAAGDPHAAVHAGEDTVANPVRIVALHGDINGKYTLAKAARFYAGGDIKDVQIKTQHFSVDDVTSLVAGQAVIFNTPRDATGNQVANGDGVKVAGSGHLFVQAGTDVDLGNSNGLSSIGNTESATLAEKGATITVLAGVSGQPDYEGFIKGYFSEAQKLEVANYVRSMVGDPGLSDALALDMFDELAGDQQFASPVSRLAIQRFYDEIRRSAQLASTNGNQYYGEGYKAIETLFPGTANQTRETSPAYDISLLFSQIKTLAGGDINLLVPSGSINAGQTTPPSQSGSNKTADQLGILAIDSGAINMFIDQDLLVNESRVFTLRGGDIVVWSSHGDIDAGKGAKSTVSAPPPLVITNPATGQTSLKVVSVTGSGIRALLTDKSIDPTTVDIVLAAPEGTVNAGDAGIATAGNLTIAAERVLGADNIKVGGLSAGVPAADTSSLAPPAASFTPAETASTGGGAQALASKSGDANKDVADARQALASFKPSFISVEVLGFGGDTSSLGTSDDEAERRRRQLERKERQLM